MYRGDITGHVRETHENCTRTTCMVCDLFICKICFGCEGSLLPVCPGRRLTMDEHDKNYAHYCAGTGPFARPMYQNVREAWVFAQHYAADCPESGGAQRFRDAVTDLWQWVCANVCAICTLPRDGGIVQPAAVFVCNDCTKNKVCP